MLEVDLWKISFRLDICTDGFGGSTTIVEVGAIDLRILLDFVVVLFSMSEGFDVFEGVLDMVANSLHTCWLSSEGTGSAVLIRGSVFCRGMPNNFRSKCFIVVDLLFPKVLGSGRAPDIVASLEEMRGGAWKKRVENR